MSNDKKRLGQIGEDLAARYLINIGYTIIARNFRAHQYLDRYEACSPGRITAELDIVALERDTLIFAEVKTRRSTRWGVPAESVTPAKIAKLRLAAQIYLSLHKPDYTSIRFDAICLLFQTAGWTIKHFKNIC